MFSRENTYSFDGHPLRNPFWRELEEEGTLTSRDNYQFELKSEFFVDPRAKKTFFSQEFYLFVPKTLQVNSDTYSAQQFYQDQTNLIRFKTPYLHFRDLIDSNNPRSPLYRIQTKEDREKSLQEMMLFGNIFRTSLRFRVRKLLKQIRYLQESKQEIELDAPIKELIEDVQAAREVFAKTKDFLIGHYSQKRFVEQLNYIDEYISIVIEEYITLLLYVFREQKNPNLATSDLMLCVLLEREEEYRKEHRLHYKGDGKRESILYRQGLLEKFMLSSLKLNNTRRELKEKYSHIFGALAAGFAMLVYMTLLAWNSTSIVINSAPFVFLAVVLYILKDRVKEGMKILFIKNFNRWFPDYRTRIYSPNGEIIGRLSESFIFIPKKKLPEGFYNLRMGKVDDSLELYQPNESILQYKKEVELYKIQGNLTELNTIFRYNIHKFVQKANEALQPTLRLNSDTYDLDEMLLPKVYHLHLILKSNFLDRKGKRCEEIKSFGIVLDKNGIKRVEEISTLAEA